MCITCIQKGEDCDGLLNDIILPLVTRILADFNPVTRKELCQFSQIVLTSRYQKSNGSGNSNNVTSAEVMTKVDRQLLSLLLILQGK